MPASSRTLPFGRRDPRGLAYARPDHAGRIVIDGAFANGFSDSLELLLALGSIEVLGTAVTWTLRRLLRTTQSQRQTVAAHEPSAVHQGFEARAADAGGGLPG